MSKAVFRCSGCGIKIQTKIIRQCRKCAGKLRGL